MLASVSYIIAGLTLGVLFVLLGWAAPPTGMWGGAIGTLIVLYVLGKSSVKIKRVLAVEEEGPVPASQTPREGGWAYWALVVICFAFGLPLAAYAGDLAGGPTGGGVGILLYLVAWSFYGGLRKMKQGRGQEQKGDEQ